MTALQNILAAGLGGFIGAAARYSAGLLFAQLPFVHNKELSTLAVNVLGSFLIGIFICCLEGKHHMWTVFIVAGVLGGFTTFSAFAYDTYNLHASGMTLKALANIFFNVALCLLFVWLGTLSAKYFLS